MSAELALSFVLRYNGRGGTELVRDVQAIDRALKATDQTGRTLSATTRGVEQAMRAVQGVSASQLSGGFFSRLLSDARAANNAVAALERTISRARSGLMTFGAATAGLAAGRAIVGDPVRQTMSYDRQLANLANTAYAGQSMDARRAGMRTLDAAVSDSVRLGGGTREGAMATLDRLLASGVFSDVAEAAKLLPALTRGGTAANADPSQLADIAIRAKQTFGVDNAPLAIDQAMRAGQLGGFELRDMAKWLPQQMAAARQAGLSGMSGFQTLLAANQASAITAGSKDEAGNNLVNLLAKINSQDTAKDAERLGINLSGSLASARAQGVNGLDAFVNLVEQIAGRDKQFVALRAKAASSTGDEQMATYSSMSDILQGSAIGKIVQDRQALMALVGIMNNRQYMQGIQGKLGSAQGTTDAAFGLVSETSSYKAEQLAAEKAIAMQTALDRVNPLLGGMAEGVTGLMRDFPLLSAAAVAATTALTALAAVAGVGSLAKVLGGGAASAAGGAAAGTAARTVGGRLAVNAALASTAPVAAWGATAGTAATAVAGVTAAGAVGYGAGTLLNAGINKLDVSTGIGIGAVIGREIARILSPFSKDAREAFARNEAQRLGIVLQIDGRAIATAVNEHNSRTANRN